MAIGHVTQAQGCELVNEGNSPIGSGALTLLTGTIVNVEGEHYQQYVSFDERVSAR